MSDKDEYNKRLQKRLLLLKEELDKGKLKLHIKEGLKIEESLKAVRYAPDGSIDLSTVDASVKSLALAVEYFHNRNEIKQKISLREIQESFFKIIHSNFGFYYEKMVESRATPQKFAHFLSSKSDVIESINPDIDEFLDLVSNIGSILLKQHNI